jgi:hypothetical protein
MAKIKVAILRFNHINLDLYANPDGIGANYMTAPDDVSLPRIEVGLQEEWDDVFSNLIHEAFEAAIMQYQGSYTRVMDCTSDAGCRLFVFDHSTFSEIAEQVARFLPEATTKLEKVWKKVREETLSGKRRIKKEI